jgi:cytochrome c-type protein NapB
MKRAHLVSLALSSLALAALFAAGDPPRKPAAGAVSDSALSLYPGSVFVAPTPPGYAANTVEPGEAERLPRAYPGAPPRIPHGIADFVPITRAANACMDCHAPGAGDDETPEIPASHRTDLRHAPGRVGDALVGARYNCTTCHVPLTDARPLVENPAGVTASAPGRADHD